MIYESILTLLIMPWLCYSASSLPHRGDRNHVAQLENLTSLTVTFTGRQFFREGKITENGRTLPLKPSTFKLTLTDTTAELERTFDDEWVSNVWAKYVSHRDVMSKWRTAKGGISKKFARGKITSITPDRKTVNIRFNDGETQTGLDMGDYGVKPVEIVEKIKRLQITNGPLPYWIFSHATARTYRIRHVKIESIDIKYKRSVLGCKVRRTYALFNKMELGQTSDTVQGKLLKAIGKSEMFSHYYFKWKRENSKKLRTFKKSERTQRSPTRKALLVTMEYPGSGSEELEGGYYGGNQMKEFLINNLDFRESEVTVFTDKETPISLDALHDKLIDFFKDTMPGDVLVLYFSGHGEQAIYKGKFEPNRKSEYSIGDDIVNGEQLDRQSKDSEEKSNTIKIENVCAADGNYYGIQDAMMHSSEGVKIIGIFDCCHSGKLFGNKYTLNLESGKWKNSQQRRKDEKRIVIGISACKADQTSFGENFLRALRHATLPIVRVREELKYYKRKGKELKYYNELKGKQLKVVDDLGSTVNISYNGLPYNVPKKYVEVVFEPLSVQHGVRSPALPYLACARRNAFHIVYEGHTPGDTLDCYEGSKVKLVDDSKIKPRGRGFKKDEEVILCSDNHWDNGYGNGFVKIKKKPTGKARWEHVSNLMPRRKQDLTVTCSTDRLNFEKFSFYDLFSKDKIMPSHPHKQVPKNRLLAMAREDAARKEVIQPKLQVSRSRREI